MNFRIFFGPDDYDGGQAEEYDNGPAYDEYEGEPADDVAVGYEEPEQQPFFTLEDAKGKQQHFYNQDELKKYFQDAGMMRSDYNRKTQSLAEQRKAFEAERDRMMQEINDKKQRYDRYDQFLRENPHVAQQLKKLVDEAKSGGGAASMKNNAMLNQLKEELEGKISELDSWRQEQEFNRLQEGVMSKMESRYEDFDRSEIGSMLEDLNPNSLEQVVELLYHAARGKTKGAQLVERVQRSKQARRGSRVLPGGSSPPSGERQFGSLEEAKEAAMQELGG